MKRTLTLTLAVFLIAAAAMADVTGSWTASTDDVRDGRIHFNINRGRSHNMGDTFDLSDFSGLTSAAVQSSVQTPVKFDMRREAGHVAFEGVFRGGDGAGHFTFTPNHAYANTIRALGVEFDLDRHGKRSDEEDLFVLAVHDVSTDFIRSMQAEGFKVGLEKYLTMRIFNVTPEYIREMRSLGYKDISAEKLVETKIHKVTPDYIRKMRAAGWDLSLSQLTSSRIHGATPEFAEQMRKLGYGDLDHDELVSFRIHRVTPEYIDEMRKLGYDNIDADDLVAMRIHRVTPEFIKELEEAGYTKVPVEKLISMRIHGVDAKFIKKMNDID